MFVRTVLFIYYEICSTHDEKHACYNDWLVLDKRLLLSHNYFQHSAWSAAEYDARTGYY